MAPALPTGKAWSASWDVTTAANIKWKTPIPGLGTSSPIVWGDRVIVVSAASDEDKTFRTGLTGDITPIATLPVHTYRIHSIDRASGRIAWQRDVFTGKPITKRHFKSSQANATPVTDGRRIVAVFGSIGLLVCYDMNGTLLWKQEIGALDSGWFLDPSYQWGHSSSPIIYKSSVIVQADQARGSFIASFDLATGRELWRTLRADEVSTWATPTVITGPKGDELVTNGTKVRGYDPATGAQLWTLAPNSEIAIGTPVVLSRPGDHHRGVSADASRICGAGRRARRHLAAGREDGNRADCMEPRSRRHLHLVADRLSRPALHAE